MNYYRPREVYKDDKPTGLFRYTCMNDGKVWAVGNCSPWQSCPDCVPTDLPHVLGGPDCANCRGTRLVARAEPCPGHATPEGAYEHQRQYELDRATYHLGKDMVEPPTLHRCYICGEFTAGYAEAGVGGRHAYTLCDRHCSREWLEKVFSVGDVTSSC